MHVSKQSCCRRGTERGSTAQVLAEVEGLSQSQADWKPAPDQWSLGEVLHHLVLAEGIAGKMVSGAIKHAAEAGRLPPYPADVHAFPWQQPSPDDRWVVRVPEPAAPTHGQPIADLREAMAKQRALTGTSHAAAGSGGSSCDYRHRTEVRDALERHLRDEPTRVSKSRIKRLRSLSQPRYRLRVGEVRVFYDVTREAVEVLAIVTKAEAARWLAEHGTPSAPSGPG